MNVQSLGLAYWSLRTITITIRGNVIGTLTKMGIAEPGLVCELVIHCSACLAGCEAPKGVLFVDELPETIGGKVLKYKLRALLADHFDVAAVPR